MPVELRLLGPPAVGYRGEWVELPGTLVCSLALYLACRQRWTARDELAYLFWADLPEPNARSNLRKLIGRAKEQDWLDGLEIEPRRLRWPVASDVQAFRQALADDRLITATQHYSGPLLQGFRPAGAPEFESWLEGERATLHAQWREAVFALAHEFATSARDGLAAEALAPLRRADPLDEEALRRYAAALHQSGRRDLALDEISAFRALLEREFGGAPDPSTLALEAEIRRGETVARSGPPAVRVLAARGAAVPHDNTIEQTIRFCTSFDGTRIAYATVGEGPPLVKAANYLTHLEYDWISAFSRHWLEVLTEAHTLVRYDERGSGLSDRDAAELSFDSWVRDLEAVVDSAGLERFPLLGISQGGAVAIAFTVRHPERVSRLILHGSYARGWLHRDLTDAQLEEEKLMLSLMRLGWGRDNPAFREFFGAQIQPGASPDQRQALDTLMRVSATPETAARLEAEMHRIDVRDLAPRVGVPTLVIHPRDDASVPFEEGRLLAGLIPGARFVPLDSPNHILLEREPAWPRFVAELRDFLQAETPSPRR